MKTLTGIIAIFTLVFFYSCGESQHHEHDGQSQNAAAEPKSPADSVYKEVMAFHDEAMPKMGKLKGYEDLAKLKIDSLSKLNDAASKALKADYEKLVMSLQLAQKSMDDWMGGFEFNKYTDKDSLLQYYQSERTKAKIMRDEVLSAIDSAVARFGK